MSSYYQTLHHIIFRTKYSERTIPTEHSRELYAYIYGIIQNKHCTLLRINGMEDHIHIFSDLHPNIALSDYVKDIKVSSSHWMKQSGLFPNFRGWGRGYCALTYSQTQKEVVINYIKRQQEHHKKINFQEELIALCREEGINVDKWFFVD
jgi:REP element-mobilizing transposase RayT